MEAYRVRTGGHPPNNWSAVLAAWSWEALALIHNHQSELRESLASDLIKGAFRCDALQ